MPERAPLDEVAGLIAGAELVVGVDTGLLHLAAALGVPLVAIFAGSEPGLTGPVGNGPIAVLGAQGAAPSAEEVIEARSEAWRADQAAPARSRSWTWMMPTGLPPSTANSAVTLYRIQDLQRLADQLIGPHRLRRARHDLVNAGVEQVVAHVPAQIAVGDDADQSPRGIDDADAAEALGGHFHDRIGHRGAERRQRHRGAGVHEVAHRLEQGAELAAGMQAGRNRAR